MVVRLELTTGAQTRLGVIGAVADEDTCWNDLRYLACTGDGALFVRAISLRAGG
jgi:hypothetical protein